MKKHIPLPDVLAIDAYIEKLKEDGYVIPGLEERMHCRDVKQSANSIGLLYNGPRKWLTEVTENILPEGYTITKFTLKYSSKLGTHPYRIGYMVDVVINENKDIINVKGVKREDFMDVMMEMDMEDLTRSAMGDDLEGLLDL